jgi:hypothetical protein
MKKQNKIRHQFIYPDQDGEECLMILLILENNKIVSMARTTIPIWHKFWDEKYRYYPFCHN